MKFFIKVLLPIIAILTLTACSDDITLPTEGKQYSVIPTPMQEERAVVEIFSLACDHCRAMEDVIPTLEEMTELEFGKEHVTFNESAQRGAYLYYTAQIQMPTVPEQALVKDMFAFMQDSSVDQTAEDKRKQLVKLYANYDLTNPMALDDSENEKVYQQMVAAEAFVANTGLSSVPAFLVKGKYLVDASSHDTIEELAETINYLNKK